ncbi:S41 family peptidase [Butyrivibrio sp. FC2001]|uniref:S41 family peptidase n=1 Tax=Butyrivibrio sp. FC2001 TaxID=1280671 RepID=UPI00041495E8|nr:S41 family peptidase [Butyrivibrio sp. FC2001]
MVKSFWSRRITIGAVFIMLLLNGCGNGSSGQNVTEDPADIESLTDATPVTADEYGKYIEKQLLDVIAEQLNIDDAEVETVVSDDLVVQEVSIDTGARELSEDDKDNLIKQIKVFCGNNVSITFSQEKGEAPYMSDYEVLWDALRNTYPYLPYLQSVGIDTDEIYSRYAEEIEAVSDEDQFYGKIESMLSELNNFAHLRVITPSEYMRAYYVPEEEKDMVAEENDPYLKVVTSPLLSKRYDVSEATEYETGSASNEEIFSQYYSDCDTLYLKISSFGWDLIYRDRDIIYESLEQYPETKHIIFDITGNSGGSNYYWTDNLISPFGGHYDYEIRNYYKSSPLFEEYRSNIVTFPVSDLSDAPDWVEDLGLDRYSKLIYSIPYDYYEGKTVNKEIKRWVLTSGNVYSAAETFTGFCKATGWATIVGTQTSGDGNHTSPILLLLPDSGVLIGFSDCVGENPDGSINAVQGTAPNIPCKKGETPLGRCLEEIRKK